MPLLSLPSELLLDIIGKVNANNSPDPHSPDKAGGWSSTQTYPCLGIFSLAQTCQLLRSLAIEYIYSSVSVQDNNNAYELHKLLTTYPHLAACVRSLILWAPLAKRFETIRLEQGTPEIPESWWQVTLFQDILGSCKGLRKLVLKRPSRWIGRERNEFNETLLEKLAPESKATIETIEFVGNHLSAVLGHFRQLLESNEFGALKSVRIEGYADQTTTDGLKISTTWPPGKLELVETFHFREPFADAIDIGRNFAQAMPNVKVLFMAATPDYVHATLLTYVELGSHLTELEIDCNAYNTISPTNSLCQIISKLSKLRKFTAINTGMRTCHKMFTASQWTQLDFLNFGCIKGCQGIKPDRLRENLEKLTQTRPMATITITRRFSRDLISWIPEEPGNQMENYIAPLEVFEKLDPNYIDSEDEEDYEQDYDDEEEDEDEEYDYDYEYGCDDDDYDIGMDLEDIMACMGYTDEDHIPQSGLSGEGMHFLSTLGRNCEEIESDDEDSDSDYWV